MTPKMKKIIVKVPRHPYIAAHLGTREPILLDNRIRKCRVQLQRLSNRPVRSVAIAPGSPSKKIKRCIVLVQRLPDMERSELSVTPTSSIVPSNFDEESAVEQE